ncbi:MAG: Tat pathway signal protein, partial [Firmicutes bacterium]|nr:Tat pathway signal protein [Bacillota bacterium]
AVDSEEKTERCAGVSADVAKKTVELLNAYFDNKFTPVHKSEGVDTCKSCHSTDIQGKDNCINCHGDVDDIHDF